MIEAVIGILTNDLGQVLIALRPEGKPLAGLWEFPGGKIHEGETPLDALHRELDEEIDIRLSHAVHALQTSYEYPDRRVVLDAWHVKDFDGTPRGREGQKIAWVNAEELENFTFPEANQTIVEWVKSLLDEGKA